MEPKLTWYLLQTLEIRTVLTRIYKLYMQNNHALFLDGIRCNNDLIVVLKILLRNKKISQQDIVKLSMLSKQKVSKIIINLKNKQFVEQEPNQNKLKNLKLLLTESGKAFAIKVFKKLLPFDQAALRRIYCGDEAIPHLIRNLQDYAENLAAVHKKKKSA